MNWQQIASLAIVALAATLLVRQEWHRRQRAKMHPCGSDCGCSSLDALERMKAQANSEHAND